MNIKSAYKEVVQSLIDCYIAGEFDARYLANEILSVPLPEADNALEVEAIKKYYAWLVRELNNKETDNIS